MEEGTKDGWQLARERKEARREAIDKALKKRNDEKVAGYFIGPINSKMLIYIYDVLILK